MPCKLDFFAHRRLTRMHKCAKDGYTCAKKNNNKKLIKNI